MNEFRRSLLFCGAICALITSPLLILAHPMAHLSYTSEWARDMANYSLLVGIILLGIGLFGLRRDFTSKSQESAKKDYPPNRFATASIVMSFPLFGLMTWGVTSFVGIVFGVLGLRKACLIDGVGGKERAITGICVSFATIPVMILMLLFLGP